MLLKSATRENTQGLSNSSFIRGNFLCEWHRAKKQPREQQDTGVTKSAPHGRAGAMSYIPGSHSSMATMSRNAYRFYYFIIPIEQSDIMCFFIGCTEKVDKSTQLNVCVHILLSSQSRLVNDLVYIYTIRVLFKTAYLICQNQLKLDKGIISFSGFDNILGTLKSLPEIFISR